MAGRQQDNLELLEVLEQLPRDLLRASVWLQLADSNEPPTRSPFLHYSVTRPESSNTAQPSSLLGRAFRLSSHGMRSLADQLTRRLQIPNCCTEDFEEVSLFFARQESIEELTLDNYTRDKDVIHILRTGGIGCQRLRVLRFNQEHGLTSASALAIAQYCPNVHELTLCVNEGFCSNAQFFLPFCDSPNLTKVTIAEQGSYVELGPILRSLASPPHLVTLVLKGELNAIDELESLLHLTALHGLRDLSLPTIWSWADESEDENAALGNSLGSVIGGLVQLTRLVVPAGHKETCRFINAMVEQLSGLSSLASLAVGCHCENPGRLRTGFNALRRLTSLTRLFCPTIGRQPASYTNSLHLIQKLGFENEITVHSLEATLCALMPLLHLRELTLTLHLIAENEDDDHFTSCHTDYEPMAAAAAGSAGRMLAGAPHLRRVNLAVHSTCASWHLPFDVTHCLLSAISDRLSTLDLRNLPDGLLQTLWPVVCQATRLEALGLARSLLPDKALVVLGTALPRLRVLEVCECKGLSAAAAVALAEVRLQPLLITWTPKLSAEEACAFQAMACAGVRMRGLV